MKLLLTTLIAIALMISANEAAAHGTGDQAKSPNVTRKEQKAWGIAGDAKSVKRTIEIRMLDSMRFSPDQIDIKLGDTVKFVVKNTGTVMHEFVIGTATENAEHAALMVKFPNMEHDEPYMAHVPPGKTGEIFWKFNKTGSFDFACLIAGHYQAGMIGRISVKS